MKSILYSLFSVIMMLATACNDDKNISENEEFTGREVIYDLLQGAEFPIHGTVAFKERKDYSLQVHVKLNGTEGDAFHPVHLHYGDISTPDAEMAAQLNDLSAETGESITILTRLMDESTFRYDDLLNFEGSVKVHLSASGDGRNIVLAGGNIGAAADKAGSMGRIKISVCQSE